MDLSCLLSSIEQVPGYQDLKGELLDSRENRIKLMVHDAVKPFVIAALHGELYVPILVIASQSEGAKRLYDELQAWCPASASVKFFPETDLMAGEYYASDFSTVAERLRTLSALGLHQNMSLEGRGSPLIVSSVLAVIGKTMSQEDFVISCHTLEVGMNVELLQLVQKVRDQLRTA